MPSALPDRSRRARALRKARCAPAWVRAMSDRDLHGVVGRFVRLQRTQDLTPGQEWLLEIGFADLEWRRRTCYPVWRSCSCQFCVPPFIDGDDDAG
jgi:hypothetical protein